MQRLHTTLLSHSCVYIFCDFSAIGNCHPVHNILSNSWRLGFAPIAAHHTQSFQDSWGMLSCREELAASLPDFPHMFSFGIRPRPSSWPCSSVFFLNCHRSRRQQHDARAEETGMPMPSSRAAKTHGTLPERSRRARHGNVRHAQVLARTGVREPRGLFLRTSPRAPHGARCSNAQDGGAPDGGGPASIG